MKNILYDQLRKLCELHILIDDGKTDTKEANDLRDLMDGPFRAMDERTIQACRNFSVYMYRVLEYAEPKRTKETRWKRPFRDPSTERMKMSNIKRKIRAAFSNAVSRRDGHTCVMCDADVPLDIHHIIDRNLMPNGGYVAENGISLCSACHIKAEEFHSTGTAHLGYSQDDLFAKIGSSEKAARDASEKLEVA